MSEVKEFIKELKPKEFNRLDKDDRTYLVYDNIPMLVNFYITKGHKSHDIVTELFDRMENPKFAKTLSKILKTDDTTPIEPSMATLIADFLEKRHANLDEEVLEAYGDVVAKILKKRVKKVNKKLGLSKEFVQELLLVVATPEAISDKRFVGIYVQRILRKLYAMSKDAPLEVEDVETMEKLFYGIFGKDEELMNYIAVNVLLERKDFIRNFNETQKQTWGLLTNFALAVLEANKKKELREYIEYYVMRRSKDAKNKRDSARRIQFAQISEEDYPKLVKVSRNLSEKEEFAQFL